MPMLLPEVGSTMRNQLEIWFQKSDIHPRIHGEFGDSALLKAFGQAGAGIRRAHKREERRRVKISRRHHR